MSDKWKELREAHYHIEQYPWSDDAKSAIVKASNALLSSHDAQAAEIERLREALEKVDDAMKNYERMGEVCPFEGQPMIHAETLIELGDAARAALGEKP